MSGRYILFYINNIVLKLYFEKNFKLSEKLQDWYNELSYALHLDSSNNILLYHYFYIILFIITVIITAELFAYVMILYL